MRERPLRGGRDGEKSAEDTLELVATFRSRPAFHWVTRGLPATRRVVAVRTMRQALFTAHLGTTVIHGDVHPGNVLVRCGVPHADPVFIGARARLARAQGRQLGASILGSPRARCDGITARSRECISRSVASRPCSRKTCAAPTGGLALPMLSLERFATTLTSLLERAGEMSWDRCHYYASRYAERGLRFTRSDSAWLAALARRTPDVVVQHVRWLAHVLAERRVPRYLLERHLAVLCNELSSALPEAFTRYAGLLQARDELPTERRAQLVDAPFSR